MKLLHLHALLLLSWTSLLLFHALVVPVADCASREAEALLKWKASLAGGDAYLSSWTLTANSSGPCHWEFIACNSAGDVTELVIMGNLNGTLAQLDFSAFTRLETLILAMNNLQGTIPEAIGNLTSLVSLQISVSPLTGPIPRSIGQLKQLTDLSLSYLDIDGKIPDVIGNLTNLQGLKLSVTSLTGSIPPTTIGRLRKLTWLDLTGNNLSGRIPLEIGNMSELQGIDLRSNHFEGALPSILSSLRKLTILFLSYNQLGGHLTSQLGNNTNLIHVDIASNNFYRISAQSICAGGALQQFEGNNNCFAGTQDLNFLNCTFLGSLQLGQNSFIGDISQLLGTLPKQLKEIYFSQNQLNGTLPLELGEFVKLSSLGLDENKITGDIPISVGNLTSLSFLNLGYNLLTGTIPPGLGKLSEISTLNLSYNQLSSPLPLTLRNLSKITILDLSNCSITGQAYDLFTDQSIYPQNISFPEIWILALSSNYITGTMPTVLCNAKDLKILDLSNNGFYGDLPDCLWDMQLLFMDLSTNSFHGVLPLLPSSSGITLQSLHLANNHFKGSFPSVIKKCHQLVTLDIGGNSFTGVIPSWIAESSPQLRFLRLSSNMFTGIIPGQILQLRNLQLLDLSQNKLTGPIPADFTNFSGMRTEYQENGEIMYFVHSEQIQLVWKNKNYTYSKTIGLFMGIDLSCNSLSQVIPEGLTTLHGLKSLNLSRNQFSGTIPKDIGNLGLLESLDLSCNHLEGEIPLSLADLKSVSILNLSNNGLSGRIPTSSQLQTLDDPSIYSNNPGLCGFPLKECANASTPTHNQTSQQRGDKEALWLYCFAIAGFIFGFWLSWGILFCNVTWRYVFYQYVDNVQEKVAIKITAHSCFGARP